MSACVPSRLRGGSPPSRSSVGCVPLALRDKFSHAAALGSPLYRLTKAGQAHKEGMPVNTAAAVNTVVAGAVACRKSSSTRVAPTAQLILKPARDSRLSPRSPPTARPCPGHCRGGPAPQTWATRPRGREAEHRYDVLLFQGRTLPAGPIGRLATTPWTSGVGPGRRRDPPSPPRLP